MRVARITVGVTIVAVAVLAFPFAALATEWEAPIAVGSPRDPGGSVAVNDAGYAAFVGGSRTHHDPMRRLTLRMLDPSNVASTSKLTLPAGFKTLGGRPFISPTGGVIVLAAAARAKPSPWPQLLIASGTVTSLPRVARVLSVGCEQTRACSLADPPSLVWRPDGSAVVGWTELNLAGRGSAEYARVRAAVIGPDGQPGEAVTLADESLRQGIQLGVTGTGTVIATWVTAGRSLVTRRLAPGGSWSAPESESLQLPRVPGPWADVFTDRAGSQYAIWTHGWRRPRIRAAYRSAGGHFTRPMTLARIDARGEKDLWFDADAGADGTAIVAWSLQRSTREGQQRSLRASARPTRRGTRGSLRVRIARPGKGWTGTQRLGGRRRFPGFPSAGVAADGTVMLTWSEYGRWRGRTAPATQILAATASPGLAFSTPAAIPGTLTRRGSCANGELAVAPAGAAVLLLDCPGPSIARATGLPG
jgi:hypothetical protein